MLSIEKKYLKQQRQVRVINIVICIIYNQIFSGKIRVEWDSGNENVYRYDEANECYDIEPVNEPRRLENELIVVGCRVKRGTVSNKCMKKVVAFND